MAYIFYDTETTGTRTTFDQILQFAAIKTDAEFNIVDTFNIRCRLLPYIVPSPGALLVTGVTIADIITCPTSHFEMMRQVHTKMLEWSTGGAIFVGWNSMRFDETLLRQGYYQTLLPVYQTNTNGNGRADMMRMAQVVSACAPNILAIPLKEDGKRAFKLGLVAEANNVPLEHAHDALGDTTATLGIAKFINKRAPDVWNTMMENARKRGPLKLIQKEPFLLLTENYFSAAYNFIVAAIAPNADNNSEWGFFDLQFDPADYLDASDDDLRAAIDGKTKAIRRVSVNSQPALLPVSFAPDDIRGGRHPLEVYQSRAKLIREHATFRGRIVRLLAGRYEDKAEPIHLEERIYSGFPTYDDQTRMHSFHESNWNDRINIIKEIEDDRYRELGQRILSTERPDFLTRKERQDWNAWCRKRLCPTIDTPWLSVARALEELSDLTENARPDQRDHIRDIDRFLNDLANERTN